MSKHRQEGIAKESKRVNYECVCIFIFMVVCIYVRKCLVSFGYVILLSLDFNYWWLGFLTLG